MTNSAISGLYKLSVAERIAELERLGWLDRAQADDLRSGRQVMAVKSADLVIENVIGVFGLPLSIAPNFVVNGDDRLVPLVVEEPSIVAALSAAARLARAHGGFTAACDESLLVGQIHITGVADLAASRVALDAAQDQLLQQANDVHPRLAARGGGVRGFETHSHTLPDGTPLLAVHVLVDTCDAMGANLVNTICESIADRVGAICGGDVALRILSNLADRSLVRATVRYPSASLGTGEINGDVLRDRIVLANDIARVDPHRAATHNKGVMNGIDALAIATGNDWRAIEAGAHAWAASTGQYRALTHWRRGRNGDLVGDIEIPLKVGIVGGTLSSNPAARLGLALSGAASAVELAELMAAVGLAQNFAAVRALAGSGIQRGHMRLHARSLAAGAGAPPERIDEIVERLVAEGEIKAWKAEQAVAELDTRADLSADAASAAGKVILFGEHAVVYGRHAVAVPIADAVRAQVSDGEGGTTIHVPDWQLRAAIDRRSETGLNALVNRILHLMALDGMHLRIDVRTRLPRGKGLGSSAAFAVAIARAVALYVDRSLDDEDVNAIAFECEKLAHGTPSGVDNTLACFGQPLLFRRGEGTELRALTLVKPPPLVIGVAHGSAATHEMVAGVRERRDRAADHYDAVFDRMDLLGLRGADALVAGDHERLGALMNVCHGLLNAIEVSTPELERMVTLARDHGALGAKLTGAGGGGSIVALCPGTADRVRSALGEAGYETIDLSAAEESGP